MRLEYSGIKKDGKFRVVWQENFKKELDELPDGRYRIRVDKWRKEKSNAQLGYLFAVIYPLVLRGLNDVGWEFTNLDQVDAECKKQFANQEILNRNTGEIMTIPALKRDMTTTEFATYVDAIRVWSAEYLNIEIPEPEENFKIEYNDLR